MGMFLFSKYNCIVIAFRLTQRKLFASLNGNFDLKLIV